MLSGLPTGLSATRILGRSAVQERLAHLYRISLGERPAEVTWEVSARGLDGTLLPWYLGSTALDPELMK